MAVLVADREGRQDDQPAAVPCKDRGSFGETGGLQNRVAGLRQDRGVRRQILRVRVDDEDGGGGFMDREIISRRKIQNSQYSR